MSRDIDARLADLDRRLREIQEELLPGREPRPVASAADEPPSPAAGEEEPPPPPPPPPEPPARAEPPPPPPPPPSPPPPPPPPPAPGREPSTAPLTELHAKLLASFRQLLDAYEWLLAQTAQTPAPPSQPLTVAAGPFQSTDDVRGFEAALAALPGVHGVSVRGYEGNDRAIFDVDVGEP